MLTIYRINELGIDEGFSELDNSFKLDSDDSMKERTKTITNADIKQFGPTISQPSVHIKCMKSNKLWSEESKKNKMEKNKDSIDDLLLKVDELIEFQDKTRSELATAAKQCKGLNLKGKSKKVSIKTFSSGNLLFSSKIDILSLKKHIKGAEKGKVDYTKNLTVYRSIN